MKYRKRTLAGQVKLEWKARIRAGEVILCGICNEPVPIRANKMQRISKGGKGGMSVDHRVPKSKGGTDDRSNLQPTHTKCNWDKADE